MVERAVLRAVHNFPLDFVRFLFVFRNVTHYFATSSITDSKLVQRDLDLNRVADNFSTKGLFSFAFATTCRCSGSIIGGVF